jgi:CTP:molybdopterin cytidylyltransferase MocA
MPGARFVPVDPGAPPLASLLALLRDKDFSGWCSVHHVDMPVWSETLFSPPAEAEADAVIPVYEGRGGHPVLLRERLIAPLLELDPERDRLDAFLRTRDTLRRETDRPEAVANWNQGPPS